MPSEDVLGRLRLETRAAHDRLERNLDIFGRLTTARGRRQVVERFYGWHAGAEEALSPVLSGVLGLDYSARSRLGLLRSDLVAIGADGAETLPVCAVEPPATILEALGMLYVLEGSTLGGRVIRREMTAAGLSMTGLAFLDPYGGLAGERWRGFLSVLRRESPAGNLTGRDEVVRGGLAGFRQAEAWLCGGTSDCGSTGPDPIRL